MSARGHLYADNGQRVNAQTYRPYPPGQAPPRDDLKEPWASDQAYTTTWHVEGDTAAAMREHGMRSATLYINVPTCGKDSGDPKRCHANLDKIMPEGSELMVWSVHENGGKMRIRYKGTGEAIK